MCQTILRALNKGYFLGSCPPHACSGYLPTSWQANWLLLGRITYSWLVSDAAALKSPLANPGFCNACAKSRLSQHWPSLSVQERCTLQVSLFCACAQTFVFDKRVFAYKMSVLLMSPKRKPSLLRNACACGSFPSLRCKLPLL